MPIASVSHAGPLDVGKPRNQTPRILLVEDNDVRIQTFRAWLAGTEFRLIEASSGGRAKGILRKGMTDGIAGLCLDQDLNEQPVTTADLTLSASDLIDAIIMSLPRSTPVLIHSMNSMRPAEMQRRLETAGFSVTRIRMAALSRQLFAGWLDVVCAEWER